MFSDHPYYNWTVTWCEQYDQRLFDPDYPSLPLAELLPVVVRVKSRRQYILVESFAPKAGAISGQEESSVGTNATDAEILEPRGHC